MGYKRKGSRIEVNRNGRLQRGGFLGAVQGSGYQRDRCPD